jgi:predicted DNA-binding transcriptional regulator AlpA
VSSTVRVMPSKKASEQDRFSGMLDERRRLQVRLAELEAEIDESLARRAVAVQPAPSRDRFAYRIDEVAELIGVSPMSVRRAIDRGDLPAKVMDPSAATGVRLVRAADLEAWLNGLDEGRG